MHGCAAWAALLTGSCLISHVATAPTSAAFIPHLRLPFRTAEAPTCSCPRQHLSRTVRAGAVMQMSSGEEGLANFNDLKTRLETAVASENYAEAARLRDEIQSQNR